MKVAASSSLNCQKLCLLQLYVGYECKCTVNAYIAIPIFICVEQCYDKFDIMITSFISFLSASEQLFEISAIYGYNLVFNNSVISQCDIECTHFS